MPVLLVEDDPSTLFAYAEQLSRAGFHVIKADTGQHALDLFEEGVHPSVVVVDLGLPDVNGRDLLTYMHDDVALRHVPTLVVRAADPDSVQVSVDAILFKPVSQTDLVSAVRQLRTRDRHSSRRSPRMRATVVKRTPETPPPALHCPTCDGALKYERTIFSGVNPVERWDLYTCRGCGPLEYRHRTRHLRRTTT
jgi:DNA-binding response OmpR family regulator